MQNEKCKMKDKNSKRILLYQYGTKLQILKVGSYSITASNRKIPRIFNKKQFRRLIKFLISNFELPISNFL